VMVSVPSHILDKQLTTDLQRLSDVLGVDLWIDSLSSRQ